MKRNYKKLPKYDYRMLGQFGLLLFFAFIIWRILTPSSNELTRVSSPNGEITARLRQIFFVSEPSYLVCYREKGKFAWFNLLHMEKYTNTTEEIQSASLEWSPDSENLMLKMNNEYVWRHNFMHPEHLPTSTTTNQ